MTLIDEVIGPTPERLAKAGDDIEETSATQSQNWRAIRMLDGHVIERLRNRDAISGDLYNAGCQFYSDWYHAGLASSGVIENVKQRRNGKRSLHCLQVLHAVTERYWIKFNTTPFAAKLQRAIRNCHQSAERIENQIAGV